MPTPRARIFNFLAIVLLAVVLTSEAAAQRQVNQGQLIAALNNIAVNIGELNALNDLSIEDVQLVNVEDVLNNNNVLNNALNRNDVDINILRNLLNNNSCSVVAVCHSLNNVLNNNNVLISDVIAIDVLSGGDVIIFHR